MLDVQIQDSAIQRKLNNALALFGDLSPVFDEFGVWQDGATDDLFEKERDPYGDRWAALKETTLARKQQRGEFLKILQATGRMRASAVSKSMKSGYKHGFTDPKSKFHDKAKNPDRKRQLLFDEQRGMSREAEQKLAQIVTRRLG